MPLLILTSLSLGSCDKRTDALEATIADQAQKLSELESVVLRQASQITQTDTMLEQLTSTVDSLSKDSLRTDSNQSGNKA